MKSTQYQPKTGQPCGCRRGQQRDNCPQCEGTGQRIDFAAIRARRLVIDPSPDGLHKDEARMMREMDL